MEMSDAVPVYIQSDHDALIARHGGEPVALLRELDEARNRIAELEEDLERMIAARNRDHQQALENGAAAAAERDRREAAERLLHNYAALANDAMRAANYGGAEYDRDGEMADYHAHVARYDYD